MMKRSELLLGRATDAFESVAEAGALGKVATAEEAGAVGAFICGVTSALGVTVGALGAVEGVTGKIGRAHV